MATSLTGCPCTPEEFENVPDITFTVNGDKFKIPNHNWVERGDGICVLKFMHAPARDDWILGLNFFENYYTVFDYEN